MKRVKMMRSATGGRRPQVADREGARRGYAMDWLVQAATMISSRMCSAHLWIYSIHGDMTIVMISNDGRTNASYNPSLKCAPISVRDHRSRSPCTPSSRPTRYCACSGSYGPQTIFRLLKVTHSSTSITIPLSTRTTSSPRVSGRFSRFQRFVDG